MFKQIIRSKSTLYQTQIFKIQNFKTQNFQSQIFKTQNFKKTYSTIVFSETPTESIKKLQERLNLPIKPNLFTRSLTHHSYGVGIIPNNLKYSFLGKHVLDFYATEIILQRYKYDEDVLSFLRAVYTNVPRLFSVGIDMQLIEAVRVAEWDNLPIDRKKDVIATAIHAVIGCIFEELGPKKAKEFINEHIMTGNVKEIFDNLVKTNDPIHLLNSIIEAQMFITPKKIEEKTKDGNYQCHYFIGLDIIGYGISNSKYEAQKSAAYNALFYFYKWIPNE